MDCLNSHKGCRRGLNGNVTNLVWMRIKVFVVVTHSPIQPDRLEIISYKFRKNVRLCIRKNTFTISGATQLQLTVLFSKNGS